MSMVRLRRLQSDYDRLSSMISKHPRLQLLRAEGSPPEKYQVEYKVRSLRQKDGELMEVGSHIVEIHLPRDYPRTPPLCRMLTPVFHPNIAPHAICIGDHWSAGESLPSLVTRIGEMLAYQSYNTKSPLNGEAAKWVDQNIERLPLDPVNMLVDEDHAAPSTAAPVAPMAIPRKPSPPNRVSGVGSRVSGEDTAPVGSDPNPETRTPKPALSNEPPLAAQIVICPACNAKIRVKPGTGAFRCPRCKTGINMS